MINKKNTLFIIWLVNTCRTAINLKNFILRTHRMQQNCGVLHQGESRPLDGYKTFRAHDSLHFLHFYPSSSPSQNNNQGGTTPSPAEAAIPPLRLGRYNAHFFWNFCFIQSLFVFDFILSNPPSRKIYAFLNFFFNLFVFGAKIVGMQLLLVCLTVPIGGDGFDCWVFLPFVWSRGSI